MERRRVSAVNGLENMRNTTLYEALMRFPLEATGGRYSFLQRLCRENGWTGEEGRRAIEEYKRFVYLATVSSVPVTPPPAVDQVWHLHLLYTKSYWEEFCGGVLGRPLHHGPTEGGREEDEKFDGWYERTMELYSEVFGEPPPEVWPARFSPENRYRWTNLTRNWVIPKPSFSGLLPGVFPLLLLGSPGPVVLLIAIYVGLVLVIVNSVRRAKRHQGGEGGGGGGGDVSSFFGDSGGGDCGGGDSSGGDCGGGDGGGGCGGGGCGGD